MKKENFEELWNRMLEETIVTVDEERAATDLDWAINYNSKSGYYEVYFGERGQKSTGQIFRTEAEAWKFLFEQKSFENKKIQVFDKKHPIKSTVELISGIMVLLLVPIALLGYFCFPDHFIKIVSVCLAIIVIPMLYNGIRMFSLEHFIHSMFTILVPGFFILLAVLTLFIKQIGETPFKYFFVVYFIVFMIFCFLEPIALCIEKIKEKKSKKTKTKESEKEKLN